MPSGCEVHSRWKHVLDAQFRGWLAGWLAGLCLDNRHVARRVIAQQFVMACTCSIAFREGLFSAAQAAVAQQPVKSH